MSKIKLNPILKWGRLVEVLDYREDGNLIWRKTLSHTGQAGSVAGYVNLDGYTAIQIDSVMYTLHRLVFMWHHGYMPEKQIDHIDRNRSNNKIENLREVGHGCNVRNSFPSKRNKTGIKGVWYSEERRKFESKITINKKIIRLGRFETVFEAAIARYNAECEFANDSCVRFSSAKAYIYSNWNSIKLV